ncbi:MAG TPA: aspartyl/asparaginyl beta-hydroxylase domain-containing protein, partial [Allosphingosinicella sp.]|nr:aspartyl/asparaginyl beta-hydroxylase domain-containing protein [Allosphingosinicella sp.]
MTDLRTPDSAATLEAEADRAAARGDRGGARRLLGQVTAAAPDRIEPWLKLAATCRAEGDLAASLEAISGALRIQPLGFVPLLFKASLLEAAGRMDEAGEAYGYALAQQPAEVPPHLAAAIERARQVNGAYVERAAAALADAAGAFEARLSDSERSRLTRFTSNIVRKTRPFHSEPTHFHYPGLVEREFHERSDFPWLAEVEAATDAIAAEFEAVMSAERAELVPYIQYSADQPVRQWAGLNWNRAW